MTDMRELKYILEILLVEMTKGNVGTHQTPLYDIAKNVRYNFYHTDKDQLNEISNATKLFDLDQYFTELNNQAGCFFPEFSPFFRGCISISSSV